MKGEFESYEKILKIIVIVLILVLLIFVINTIRNVHIINKLKDNANQYFSDVNSYKIHIEANVKYTIGDEKQINFQKNIEDIYYKDNKYLIKETINNDEPYVNLIDKENNQYVDFIDYLEAMKIDRLKKQFYISNIKLYVLDLRITYRNSKLIVRN